MILKNKIIFFTLTLKFDIYSKVSAVEDIDVLFADEKFYKII